MKRYLLTKEHFTDGQEWCYRSCLYTIETGGSRNIWDIVKMDTEEDLDEFIERVYGVKAPPADSEISFDSTIEGLP